MHWTFEFHTLFSMVEHKKISDVPTPTVFRFLKRQIRTQRPKTVIFCNGQPVTVSTTTCGFFFGNVMDYIKKINNTKHNTCNTDYSREKVDFFTQRTILSFLLLFISVPVLTGQSSSSRDPESRLFYLKMIC